MEWVVLGVLVAAVGYLVVAYNTMVALRRRADQAFADIDVQLKQRHDLIPNLIEAAKGYMGHERATLEAVVAARNGAVSANGAGAQAAAEQALSGALGRLFALAEAYPDLKADQTFLRLQDALSSVEDKLAAARRFFNNAVGEYNAQIESIPAVFFAKSLGFVQREFFDVGPERRDALDAPPSVKF